MKDLDLFKVRNYRNCATGNAAVATTLSSHLYESITNGFSNRQALLFLSFLLSLFFFVLSATVSSVDIFGLLSRLTGGILSRLSRHSEKRFK